MMRDDFHDRLDDLLSRWHHWAKGYIPVPTCGADPMFRNAKSSKSWDSTAEVVEDELTNSQMKSVDFHVGEMKDPHRSAIYIHARNCYTGRNVWLSPRLPQDPMERAQILGDAKAILIGKLLSAGVM
jgi:hypothetical protein